MSTSARRPGWMRALGGDVSLALVVAVFQLAGTVATAEYDDIEYRPVGWIAVLLLVVGPVTLAGRARWPLVVLGINLAATNVYLSREYPVGAGTAFLGMFVAVYTAAATGSRLRSFLVFLISAASFIATLAIFTEPGSLASYVVFAGMVLGLVAIGEASQAHRKLRVEAEQRALQAELTREVEARRRVDEERLRIARELHDVLSHSISMMNVQAGVAAHLLDERPEQARAGLLAIKQASKDALRELRATLGVLRQVDDVQPPRTPTPGLALLDDLVAETAAAGMSVEVRTDGESRNLPEGVDLAAYRIVQEALTNVRRHAGAARASVRVTYREDDLMIQVDDDGAVSAVPATNDPREPSARTVLDDRGASGWAGDRTDPAAVGTGIVGMRERAHALGGELEAGPRARGGFRVRARLPTGGGKVGGTPEGHGRGNNTDGRR